ncbi:MAG: AmpG family muropeptide MFS transporter [Gammaproteobacteria bacterium]|nr:AmpG family muropeptide MFS transporter [Gammaproteobacteria bacterium]
MNSTNNAPIKSWAEAFRVYSKPRVLGMLFLGFSAGLPFLLVFSTLSAWLNDVGIQKSVIGFFSWVGITYSIKVFWAPVIDHLKIPLLTRLLGKRRSWMLVAQAGIAIGLLGMASTNPSTHIEVIAWFALLVAFSSATQDISIDAYRIEALDKEFQAAMAATYVLGYRLALLVAGAGAFYIADFQDWPTAYISMAACMLIGIATTLIIREPVHAQNQHTEALQEEIKNKLHLKSANTPVVRLAVWFSEAVISPFVEFFKRNGKQAMIILGLIAVYKISDITMGVMANPFYLDLGFSKIEIANVTKVFGFFMTIAGAALGGVLVVRYGLFRPLVLGAVLIAATNLLFATLALSEPNTTMLALVVSADNLSGGIATSVFIAYLSSLTNSAYTATQYALFSSLMTLPAKFIGGFSGIVVEAQGYFGFFVYAAMLGLPAILIATYLMRKQSRSEGA